MVVRFLLSLFVLLSLFLFGVVFGMVQIGQFFGEEEQVKVEQKKEQTSLWKTDVDVETLIERQQEVEDHSFLQSIKTMNEIVEGVLHQPETIEEEAR
ncbi:hypothetical protein [Massilibacterium senegalense]|uniref:hypothetical protein n=1 Tax=Massilibacterium senegalense TaxID=1632858 RepID=UPI0007816B88|nr:hypothetical protein [Massilibacterium senegalense]